MSKRLPQTQLTTLVFMLFEGLADSQTNCCRASSVILNTLLKNRGGGLQDLVTHTHLHSTFAGASWVQIYFFASCVVGPRDARGATCTSAKRHRGAGKNNVTFLILFVINVYYVIAVLCCCLYFLSCLE